MNKTGETEEEREVILNAFEAHMMKGHSQRFFPMHAPRTMSRLRNDHPNFNTRMDEIIRTSNMTLEAKLISKVNDPDFKFDQQAFNKLVQNRKGWKEEKEVVAEKAQAIHITMVESRDDADQIREDQSNNE